MLHIRSKYWRSKCPYLRSIFFAEHLSHFFGAIVGGAFVMEPSIQRHCHCAVNNFGPIRDAYLGGISSSVFVSDFLPTTVISYWKSLHLIGWEQICQWKTLTKTLDEMPRWTQKRLLRPQLLFSLFTTLLSCASFSFLLNSPSCSDVFSKMARNSARKRGFFLRLRKNLRKYIRNLCCFGAGKTLHK